MLETFFSQLENGKALKVSLPLPGRAEPERIPCAYQEDSAPFFFLNFQGGIVQLDDIDTVQRCTVFIDLAGQAYSLLADIDAVINPLSLRLKAIDLINHEQQRNYFRVDASTPISTSPLLPRSISKDSEEWYLEGETIDLSGSGALCIFSHPLEVNKRVRIELVLPTGNMEVLTIIGYVVRCRKIDNAAYQVGLHFDSLTSEDQDKIMASCFKLQREHLRMKVQVKATSS